MVDPEALGNCIVLTAKSVGAELTTWFTGALNALPKYQNAPSATRTATNARRKPNFILREIKDCPESMNFSAPP
jgi:hypothetical protein